MTRLSTPRRRAPRPTVVTARGPEDLLALAAHTLGFVPEASLVVVSLRGPRKRAGLVLRVDIDGLLALADPSTGDPPALEEVAAELARPTAADAADAAVLLLCERGGPRPAHRALVSALGGALAGHGVEVEEAVLVDGGRTHSLVCDLDCCPPAGRALGDVASTVVGAELVLTGSALLADREAVVAGLLAGVAPADEAERAVVAHLVEGAGPAPRAVLVREWFALLDAVVEGVGDGASGTVRGSAGDGVAGRWRGPDQVARALLDPPRAARLLAGLADLVVRDCVLTSAVPGGRETLTARGGAFGTGRRLEERLLDALACLDLSPDLGDLTLVQAAEAVTRELARLGSGPARAAPLGVLAYWGWWQGSTVAATTLAEEALRADPQHSLASLVLQMAEHALAPDWVRAQRAATAPRRRRGERAG